MIDIKQLWLPRVKRVKPVRKRRRIPQPRLGKLRAIKKFELLHRPFDLRFRGAINKWLESTKDRKNIDFEEILDKFQGKIVSLYFYPQNPANKWLNQEEVLGKIELNSKKKLRKALVIALIQIWERVKTQ